MDDPKAYKWCDVNMMSAAFTIALKNVTDDSSASHSLDEHTWNCLASGIIAAAQDGVVDIEDLATEGLRVLKSSPEAP